MLGNVGGIPLIMIIIRSRDWFSKCPMESQISTITESDEKLVTNGGYMEFQIVQKTHGFWQ
jgi:hypothetical protein